MQPKVLAIMLVNGRERMVKRAATAFRRQTYPKKRLLIWDTSVEPLCIHEEDDGEIFEVPAPRLGTIGALRNAANAFWTEYPIICHFDSDDWSHPNRIAEQVALLEASGKEAVGYRDMLFWDSTKAQIEVDPSKPGPDGEGVLGTVKSVGEAWLYTNRNPQYCLGTSLCYWREVWQRNPFPDTSAGEDTLWLRGVKSEGICSVPDLFFSEMGRTPRMIASIHGGNTYARIEPRAEEWKRVPEWDAHCRGVMAL